MGRQVRGWALARALDPLAHSRRFLLLLALLVCARGVALMSVLPPLEGWDEYQHLAYLVHLEKHGTPPVWGQDRVAPELLRELARWPQGKYAVEQFSRGGAVSYAEYWSGVRATPAAEATLLIYQGQHPSTYYRLALPLFSLAGGVNDLPRTVAVLRWLNLLCLAGATVLFVGAVRGLGAAPWVWVPVAVAVALHPLLLLAAVRVANDALALLAGAAVLRVGAWVWTSPRFPERMVWWAALLGALTGAAILTKTTNLALVPFALVCAWVGGKGRRWAVRLAAVACALICCCLVIAPYVGGSLALYGVPIPAQETIVNHQAGKGAGDYLRAAAAISWPKYLTQWWVSRSLWVGGWSTLAAPRLVRRAHENLLWVCLLGWTMAAWRRWRGEGMAEPARGIGAALLLVIFYSGTLAAHAVSSEVAWGGVQTNPWYAAPAIPMFLLIAMGGLRRYPGQRVARIGCVLLPGLYVLAEVCGLGWVMPRAYTLTGGAEAWRRLAMLHPAWLGTTTFVIAGASALLLCAVAVMSAWRYFWATQCEVRAGVP